MAGSMKEEIMSWLKELRCAIIQGNIARVKHIDKLLHGKECLDETLFVEMCSELESQCLTKNDFIILATEHKQVEILYYLFYDTNILYYLTRKQTERELEDEERRKAFCSAMCSDNLDLLEIIYDHWCNMHRAMLHRGTDDDVIQDLQRLSRLLNEARGQCEDQLIQHQQMYVNVHCLIKFTTYQIDMLTKLRDLRLNFDCSYYSEEGEAVRERVLVLNILRIHEKYSDINYIRLKKCVDSEERLVQALLDDDSSIYMKALLNIMYEMYFRKLDFKVSSLLLSKLHILKQRLKTPVDTYQKLECALYYYIYRVSEDWRLYLPVNRKYLITDIAGVHNGTPTIMKAVTDTQQQLNAPVMYLERRHFQQILCEFKTMLQNINISGNIRKKEEKITNNEINCLRLLPLMRDDYSLKRIVQYIEPVLAIDKVNDKHTEMLMIERAIQVVGEMFKNSEESFHLSKTTKSLLQIIVGIETVKHFQKLRDKLSHAENGELTEKIRIEKTESDLYKEVKTDLETIIDRIKTVLTINKQILDKDLINKGLILLQNRLNELPDRTTSYTERISLLYRALKLYNQKSYVVLEDIVITKTSLKFTLSKQLFREIALININREKLANTRSLIKKHTRCISLGTLPSYFKSINTTLRYIKNNCELWGSIKRKLPNFENDFSDYPTQNDIERIKNKLRSLKKKGQHVDDELSRNMNLIKDGNDHWESIKEVLRFIIEDMQILEINRCSDCFYRNIQNSFPTNETMKNVYVFLKILKYQVNMYAPGTIQESVETYDFRGIGKIINLFDEKDSNKSQKEIDEYLKKREHLFESLIGRLDLLKKTLNHPNNIPINQHLVRYRCDKTFRIVIEMLLADIMGVFVACKIKRPLIKSSNLLTEINLRNVLDHGNPYLEVIGEVLDPQDIPNEFITWALTMIDDSAAIEALYTLFKDNVEYDTLQNEILDKMTVKQRHKLQVFKSCERWPYYLKLIPKSQQVYLQNTSNLEREMKSECWKKLKVAVKAKDLENVRLSMDGVDLDFVDDYGKTVLYYAAMSGHVEIMNLLIDNGAGVNVACGKSGKRPLHFAAMNGMPAAVATLLQHRADTTLADADEKLAIHYVNNEKHEQIFVQLAQHMTVQMGLYLGIVTKRLMDSDKLLA